jgi:hypothetical protein
VDAVQQLVLFNVFQRVTQNMLLMRQNALDVELVQAFAQLVRQIQLMSKKILYLELTKNKI